MANSLSAKAKTGSASGARARAPPDERQPARRDPLPAALPPAASRPSLRVLLGEIERLQAALKAEQARVKELEASADTDPLTGYSTGAASTASSSARWLT